jgi:hypothetical protein
MLVTPLFGTIGFVPVMIFLLVFGFCLYIFRNYINSTFLMIIIGLVCLALLLWLLDAFSIYPLPAAFRIGGR